MLNLNTNTWKDYFNEVYSLAQDPSSAGGSGYNYTYSHGTYDKPMNYTDLGGGKKLIE